MSKEQDKITKNLEKTAFSVFDFVIDSIIYIIALIVTIFLPVSFGSSQGVSGFVAKYKYEILKYTALVIVFVVVLTISIINSNNSQESEFAGSGLNTEITDISGIQAVVLNVPYFNQFIEANGDTGPLQRVGGGLPLGGVICGAASSTMVAGYFGKVNFSSETELKEHSYRDKGLGLPNKCRAYGVGGAFGVTAYDTLCNQSGVAGMQQYFSFFGIPTSVSFGSPSFNLVKNSIDQGKPIIISLTTKQGAGHLAVIKGYTADGRYVMNDPWTDVQSGMRNYSYRGNNALYLPDLGTEGNFKYYLIIG